MLSQSYDYARIVKHIVAGERNHNAQLVRGFLAGAVGGLIGTALKSIAEHYLPPRGADEEAPPVKLAEQVSEAVAGEEIPEDAKPAVGSTVHWLFGTLMGGLYGAGVEVVPALSQGGGIPFGTAVFGIMHEGLLPSLGVEASHAEKDTQEEGNELLTHLLYGFATEIVRDQVRPLFDRG